MIMTKTITRIKKNRRKRQKEEIEGGMIPRVLRASPSSIIPSKKCRMQEYTYPNVIQQTSSQQIEKNSNPLIVHF
jgi:hypothetical protein